MQSQNNLEIQRHSLAHVMASAIQQLYPEAKFGVGPIIENGFYYDIKVDKQLTPEILPKIEKQMKKIIAQNVEFVREEISIDEAKKLFANQPYKIELINDLVGEEKVDKVSIYKTGDFTDLCRGPHVTSTKDLKNTAFKLDRLAGAYWRGDEKNDMLTRIYGVAFESPEKLDEYLKQLEEAEKRDHRKLGQELELFMFDDEVGQGLPLWMPKGALLRQKMEDFILTEYQRRGYQLVRTPHIASEKLFSASGHLGFYKDGMYSPMDIDGEDYYVKPMNCPMHIKIYKNSPKSYRDLPIRYTELGTVYRYERSGTLHGLTRVRGFTQDDAHIICTTEQLTQEIGGVIDLTKFILNSFGFAKFKVVLSVRDPKNTSKYLGTDKDWELAEAGLKKALENAGWEYTVEEGEAVFYGPKIDIKIYDAVGREWQLSTCQLDFNLAERFDMTYTDDQGEKVRPYMLHRALLGSLERFTGVLIEHYAGNFPLWLAPVQIQLIPVGEAHREHCQQLAQELQAENLRVQIDNSDEGVGKKIRKAILQKIPYMLVIGDKEMQSKNLHVRARGSEEVNEFEKNNFITKVKKLVEEKSQEL